MALFVMNPPAGYTCLGQVYSPQGPRAPPDTNTYRWAYFLYRFQCSWPTANDILIDQL